MSGHITLPEVWLRGPVSGVPALLQPVAHTLLQAKEEVEVIMLNFPEEMLWNKVAGMASPAFHLQHMAGVLTRLLAYAANQQLSSLQLSYLATEGEYNNTINSEKLVADFATAVSDTLTRLNEIDPDTLTEFRGVGRKRLPSTVIGLLFHAAEHIMRHVGQLLVTVSVLKAEL